MPTTSGKLVVHLPADEAQEFKALVAGQDKTASAVLRRMIRDYVSRAEWEETKALDALDLERTGDA